MDDHSNDRLEGGRAILRQSLDEIETEITTAMRDANLNYPFQIHVRDSGDSLAAIMTSAHPPSDEWETAKTIFLKIIANHLGVVGLRSRDPCEGLMTGNLSARSDFLLTPAWPPSGPALHLHPGLNRVTMRVLAVDEPLVGVSVGLRVNSVFILRGPILLFPVLGILMPLMQWLVWPPIWIGLFIWAVFMVLSRILSDNGAALSPP